MKLIEPRPVREWLAEPSTREGLGVLATLLAGYLGLSPEVTVGVLSLIGLNSIRRRDS